MKYILYRILEIRDNKVSKKKMGQQAIMTLCSIAILIALQIVLARWL